MKVEEKAVNIGAKKISYTHIQNNSTKVCFMFSGAGYTYDQPLFYYSTMAMLEDHIDIVHIHYRYTHDELALPLTTLVEMVTRDVEAVMKRILASHEYNEPIIRTT
ncbi:hypothetical protein H0266_15575 [Halobacillus locisalis]|uniref:Uncharacterized protein n=1 Tax=Halobacillus locisalis TaxID=220753 RepID=A0A838CXI3_9BACI|nr:hypothetical protein [Halobacillus locisalis]MBA2176316.1 hypothetical protein [Halobacillus locisalis]